MKKMLVIVFLGISLSMSAQISPFLNKDQSGVGVFVNYENGRGLDGVGGILSYSIDGKFDVTASLNKTYYDENVNNLTGTDVTDLYYWGDFTWWAFREKLIPAVDVNVGLCLGVEGATYTNYTYLGGSYNSYLGAYGGLNANLNVNLPKKWAIQPRYAYFVGFGSDNLTELGTTSNDPYHYTYSVLGFSMIKKLNNGNALVGTFEQAMSSSSLSQWYDMSIGYIIAL